MKNVSLAILAMTICTASPAAKLSSQHGSCMDASGSVTASMLDCNGAEFARQDKRLNVVYKEVQARLSPARNKQLLTAQRAWIKYRDAKCDFYADPDGGTAASINSSTCFVEATAERVQDLEWIRDNH